MSGSVKKTVAEAEFQIQQIDRLLAAYADLLERVQQHTPDLVEIAATASVLHSFYNGLENILLALAKGVDRQVPTGSQWHRDLLVQMSRPVANREAVISPGLAGKLVDYLAFRHFYRHSYSFFLDWVELEGLVMSLQKTWSEARRELSSFLKGLQLSEP